MAKHAIPEPARDNRANQLNPEHPAYYRSRGLPEPTAAELAASHRPLTGTDASHGTPVTPQPPMAADSSDKSE